MEGVPKSGYGVKMTENKDNAPSETDEVIDWLVGPHWLDGLLPLDGDMVPEGYDPAGVFKVAEGLSEDEASAVNEACRIVSYGIWANAKIAGRQNKGKKSGRRALEKLDRTSSGAAASFIPSLKKLLSIYPILSAITFEEEEAEEAQTGEGWSVMHKLGDGGMSDGEVVVLEALAHVGLPQDTFRRLKELNYFLSEKVQEIGQYEEYIQDQKIKDSELDIRSSWRMLWVHDAAQVKIDKNTSTHRRARSYQELRDRWILSLADIYRLCTGLWPSYAREPATAGPKPKAFLEFCLRAAQVGDLIDMGKHPTRGVIFFTEESGLTHIRDTMKRYNKARSAWEAAQ